MESNHDLGAWNGDNEELFRRQYPIHHACRSGDFETLTNLLTTSDSVNFYEEDGFYGWTPIHWAAHFGKLACLRKMTILGGVGCDGTTSRFRQTPLHLSTHSGHPHCVQWLVQSGADVNSQDYLGETPIHKAARTGSMECVSLLVSQGAKLSVRNHSGLTASQVAVECGHPECAIYIQRAAEIQDQAHQPITSHSLRNGLPQAPPMTLPPSEHAPPMSHSPSNQTSVQQQQHQGILMHGHPLISSHGANNQMQQPFTTSEFSDCGMDTCDVGPGGDAGWCNGAVQCQSLKRSRDDEMEDESMKKLRKAEPQNWTSWYGPSPPTHLSPQDNELTHDNNSVTQTWKSINNNNYDNVSNVSHLISSSTVEHQNTITAQSGYDSLLEAAILEFHGN